MDEALFRFAVQSEHTRHTSKNFKLPASVRTWLLLEALHAHRTLWPQLLYATGGRMLSTGPELDNLRLAIRHQ